MKRYSGVLIIFAVLYGMSVLGIFVFVATGETGKAVLCIAGGIANTVAYHLELHRIDVRNFEVKKAQTRHVRPKGPRAL